MNTQNTREKGNIFSKHKSLTVPLFYYHPLAAKATTMFYSQNTTPDINHVANSHLIMDVTKKGFEYRYQCLQKEPMFEKPLTPSDVGKLNRLVIPKQHAENHLPPTGITNTGEKGILLSFEDESGKCWRFRYSYWTSSQSYVLTKGWSRFVKEKQLDAGDTVLFERQFVEGGCRLFIGWRRRNDTSDGAAHHQPDSGGNVQKQLQGEGGRSKILRLFGVNMECQPDELEPPTQDGSSASGPGHGSTHICMDTNFSRDDTQD